MILTGHTCGVFTCPKIVYKSELCWDHWKEKRKREAPDKPPAPPIFNFPNIDYRPWMEQSNCKDVADPDIFFPERGRNGRAARAICADCPVKEECRDYAVEMGEDFGIWGGLNERERRPYKREWKRRSA